jgi:hypothetical protein
MKPPKNSSATVSAGPVATAPPPRATSKSEAAYLHEQAANAKTAFTQTLGEIAGGLGTGISPAKWTEEHPWMMIASAAVAGFAAAYVAVPSEEQSTKKRLRNLEAALQQPPEEKHHAENGTKTEKRGLLAILIAELIRAASGIIGSLLKASMASPAPHPEPSDGDVAGTDQTS